MRITTATSPNDSSILKTTANQQEPARFAPDLDAALERESRRDRRQLEEQLAALNSAADKVDKEPTVKHFVNWRDSLAVFLRNAARQAYRVENLKSGGREYEIIRTINNEADRLYHMIAGGAKERAKVAESLVKISGLIVSLLA